jgi:hypothetical protein
VSGVAWSSFLDRTVVKWTPLVEDEKMKRSDGWVSASFPSHASMFEK